MAASNNHGLNLSTLGNGHWTQNFRYETLDITIRGQNLLWLVISMVIFPLATLTFFGAFQKSSKLPWVNRPGPFDIFKFFAKYRFLKGAREMVRKGFEDHADKPGFRMIADSGEITMLSPKFAYELKNDHRVDFVSLFLQDFHEGIPGFEFTADGARDAKLLRQVTKTQLTHQLAKITDALSIECIAALDDIFTNQKEFHKIQLRSSILQLVSRMSSRAFLGENFCRNKEWLDITTAYAGTVNKAAIMLRLWPSPIRRIVHWILPACRDARSGVQAARRVLEPMLERRRRQKAEDPNLKYDDTLEWTEQAAKGAYYDPVSVQLLFSMAAMHTTTDLITQVLLDLAAHPEMLEPLRHEIETVLIEEGGWTKASFHKMKLLDSVLKECQRMKPASISGLRGILNADVTLTGGLQLPKGTSIAVSTHLMWDENVYSNPQEWNGHRFYQLRQIPGKENSSQLISTAPEHMGFGLGSHACPGRFFATHEVKMALCHILLRYEWKLPVGEEPKTRSFMWSLVADPLADMLVRRRSP
ncbi:hypothetical protein BLS_008684 [Venturia inaequalis]|uniref:Uncharacterized protein n=1 Tax=Venturia inaequalis TaxID=5025 RepID=A0A8H3Z4M3_VENIN|nr:hypothetical protein BLS_008684 [Venturia inaequalis]KAE9984026.1 hypothetical protein EG328_009284 [Venturia inaequalis]